MLSSEVKVKKKYTRDQEGAPENLENVSKRTALYKIPLRRRGSHEKKVDGAVNIN